MAKSLTMCPVLGPNFSFVRFPSSGIVPSYYPMQVKGKLINQTCLNEEKPNSGPNFDLLDANLSPKNYFHEN